MLDTDSEKQAEELLPCGRFVNCIVDLGGNIRTDGKHYEHCSAYFRPAVAAALAEKDAEIERLKNEIDVIQWNRGYVVQMHRIEVDGLNAELAQLRADNERLEKEIQEFKLSNEKWFLEAKKAYAEKHEAYVKGLKEAEKDVHRECVAGDEQCGAILCVQSLIDAARETREPFRCLIVPE